MVKNRDIRRILNTKQDSLESYGNLSINSMTDGQMSVSKSSNGLLSIQKKKYGRVYKSYMSSDGNQIVDKNLTVSNNINVNGTVYGNQIYCYSHNFPYTGTSKIYVSWNRATVSTSIASSGKFIAPYDGRLLKVLARTESVAGSTVIGFHKAVDATTDPNSTATESADAIDMSAVDTTYEFNFTATSIFDKGDVLAISMDATNAVNDTVITSVWSFKIIL